MRTATVGQRHRNKVSQWCAVMLNRALRSRVVELEGDADMSGVCEEDLASVQKERVQEKYVVILGQNEVQIGQSQKV